jgi:hypothetical protein
MSMTRGGIIERATLPSGEMATAPGYREVQYAHNLERETRLRVTYVAYGVPYGDDKTLAHAQVTKRPGLVRVRMNGGTLELFGIDLAVTAILNGGQLEI